ncbi:hypothetical protein KIPB_007119 [Kipferlia bialata]|uniref:START domain-containing protein n=1 Tax=Kipferlia bialata TaxID=797122 RepID=A0A9K3GJS3_9EUKA|nr:hypothetical protein KIPB_007119 [Kipferlia bialata]|eukprot:g7119.t1
MTLTATVVGNDPETVEGEGVAEVYREQLERAYQEGMQDIHSLPWGDAKTETLNPSEEVPRVMEIRTGSVPKKRDGSKVKALLVTGVVNAPLANVLKYLGHNGEIKRDATRKGPLSYRHTITSSSSSDTDPNTGAAISTHFCLTHYEAADFTRLAAQRDFVVARRAVMAEERASLVYTSVEHDDYPPQEGFVRGNIYKQVYTLEAVGPGAVRVVYLSHMGFGGRVPRLLMPKVLHRTALNVIEAFRRLEARWTKKQAKACRAASLAAGAPPTSARQVGAVMSPSAEDTDDISNMSVPCSPT